ncbi:MAG: hypothetical protein OJF59_000852 [Cytophagales bacterium]|jgi:hypothetical protein|nr:DUF2851 family protein [Bacteroidota bacterium]MBS1979813.1 DUF2851 family protein [Bacteroidota bacterium]WHZ07099.1 MAG: hypothetical protein OJF59_000852 [Cytophagales bacterium]
MNESFLHYLWQFQYFNKENLLTTAGEPLVILKTGTLNAHAGPDFFNAKITIGKLEWVGNIEIHIKSSDWYAHHHQTDQAYKNVILHVVWDNDRPVVNGKEILPTLELKSRVSESLLKEYKKIINSSASVACEKMFASVNELIKISMLDKSLMQRLEIKAETVFSLLKLNKGDWEETVYQLLAKNFGFKVNADPFFLLSKSLPYKIIQKQSKLVQVEALFFGQAGLLSTRTKDPYLTSLCNEYSFLAEKFSLKKTQLNIGQWKFLRLRPANFPTLRMAQFASLLFNVKSIFSTILSAGSYQAFQKIFHRQTSEYWQTHYRFGVKANRNVPELGRSGVENLLINTVVPLLVAYGKHKDEQRYIDRAVDVLLSLPAENNSITRKWHSLGLKVKNAFDSQAILELYNHFCQRRQCLNCNIGISILKPDK